MGQKRCGWAKSFGFPLRTFGFKSEVNGMSWSPTPLTCVFKNISSTHVLRFSSLQTGDREHYRPGARCLGAPSLWNTVTQECYISARHYASGHWTREGGGGLRNLRDLVPRAVGGIQASGRHHTL